MIIIGIIAFFLVEKVTHQYLAHDHDHGSHKQTHEADKGGKGGKKGDKAAAASNGVVATEKEKQVRYQSFAIISMMGDFIHNFTDGLSIGVAY